MRAKLAALASWSFFCQGFTIFGLECVAGGWLCSGRRRTFGLSLDSGGYDGPEANPAEAREGIMIFSPGGHVEVHESIVVFARFWRIWNWWMSSELCVISVSGHRLHILHFSGKHRTQWLSLVWLLWLGCSGLEIVSFYPALPLQSFLLVVLFQRSLSGHGWCARGQLKTGCLWRLMTQLIWEVMACWTLTFRKVQHHISFFSSCSSNVGPIIYCEMYMYANCKPSVRFYPEAYWYPLATMTRIHQSCLRVKVVLALENDPGSLWLPVEVCT